jgi:hypothetical protein
MSWLAWRVGDRNAALSRALAISAIFAPLASLWPLVRGVSWRELKFGLGWHTGRGFFSRDRRGHRGIRCAVVPIFLTGIIITFLISRHTGPRAVAPDRRAISADPKARPAPAAAGERLRAAVRRRRCSAARSTITCAAAGLADRGAARRVHLRVDSPAGLGRRAQR